MQVNIETDPGTSIPTVTLHVPVDYPETAALTAALKNLSIEAATLTVSQRGQLVQLPLTSILFIEATGHQVAAHTLDNVYRVPKSLTAVGTHRLTCLLSSRLQICHCQYQTSLFLDQDIDRELDCVSPLT